MPADAARARYLADAVATATPARLIVLLYDRLWLDIQRAQAAQDSGDAAARNHLQHAQQIVAELLGSLDVNAWSGAADLASLYSYLLRELIGEVLEPRPGRLAAATKIVSDLRSSWQQAEAQLQGGAPSSSAVAAEGREAVRVG
ncbi:MAG: flagellar export chaperone FliS [Jatrophihabitantaceae bacterium]